MVYLSPSLTTRRFPYRPLDTLEKQIRLLRLKPGTSKDPLEAEIIHVHFTKHHHLVASTIDLLQSIYATHVVPFAQRHWGEPARIVRNGLRESLAEIVSQLDGALASQSCSRADSKNNERTWPHPLGSHSEPRDVSNLTHRTLSQAIEDVKAILQSLQSSGGQKDFRVPRSSPQNPFRLMSKVAQALESAYDTLEEQCIAVDCKGVVIEYETISYVWGDPHLRATMSLNGTSIDIPTSSHSSLRRARRVHTESIVWIDAVCINQNDDAERSAQVAMMDLVYNRGKRNLVFLGDFDPSLAFQEVQLLYDALLTSTGNDPEKIRGSWELDSEQKVQVAASIPLENARKVYGASWFRRLWVLQEVFSAKQSVCIAGGSDEEIDLDMVMNVVPILTFPGQPADKRLSPDDHVRLRTHHWIHLARSDGRNTLNLALLLRNSWRLKCSVGSDRVYALLGLLRRATLGLDPPIQPDYSRPTARVYAETIKVAIVQEGNDLRPLAIISRRVNSESFYDQSTPSWVPDWNTDYPHDPLHARVSHYRARGNQIRNNASNDLRGPELRTHGYTVDTLSMLRPVVTGKENSSTDPIRLLVDCDDLEHSPEAQQRYRDNTPGAFASVLFVGKTPKGDLLPLPEAAQQLSTLRTLLKQPDLSEQQHHPFPSHSPTTPTSILNQLRAACDNRKIFVTETGFFGLAPSICVPGDVVAVLNGLRWPAVLRRVPDHGQERAYRFVEICYVQGIMGGKWAGEQRAGRRGEELFVLV